MKVFVNGEVKQVPDGIGLGELLERLSMPDKRVAVELNREVIPKTRWAGTPLADEDKLEIIHFVGGG
ncbi:MAG: sulfur carrier protein ThiS [Acidobacteria bacterium]|nr:MAG: sulfur carrier protein ThiS [Acidobacteriota bacterium]REK01961.1 MAG: sulfur carrier protein ThiS [Acidobacteriota bacterium]REK14917.1 MAG: sulfur carrier protein ThiS [Acidobacteriota bacterium]REK45632.1 MAG: sulfur carrier protein ThiS [Acidobacteriota bacterium]